MKSDRIKHLEMIQTIINRLASNSFSYKAWMVGIVSALIAVSVSTKMVAIFALSLVPLTVFWLLDSYYLYQERMFRKLYDEIRLMPEDEWEENPFSMSRSAVEKQNGSFYSAAFSKTIFPLYGLLALAILIGVALRVLAMCHC